LLCAWFSSSRGLLFFFVERISRFWHLIKEENGGSGESSESRRKE
jgi:hypothetical protein